MLSDRLQRRVDALLDQADESVNAWDWTAVAEKARAAKRVGVKVLREAGGCDEPSVARA